MLPAVLVPQRALLPFEAAPSARHCRLPQPQLQPQCEFEGRNRKGKTHGPPHCRHAHAAALLPGSPHWHRPTPGAQPHWPSAPPAARSPAALQRPLRPPASPRAASARVSVFVETIQRSYCFCLVPNQRGCLFPRFVRRCIVARDQCHSQGPTALHEPCWAAAKSAGSGRVAASKQLGGYAWCLALCGVSRTRKLRRQAGDGSRGGRELGRVGSCRRLWLHVLRLTRFARWYSEVTYPLAGVAER